MDLYLRANKILTVISCKLTQTVWKQQITYVSCYDIRVFVIFHTLLGNIYFYKELQENNNLKVRRKIWPLKQLERENECSM